MEQYIMFIIPLIMFVSQLFYLFVKVKTELQMMQQNSYRNERYWRWFKNNYVVPTRLAEFLIAGIAILFASPIALGCISIYAIVWGIITLRKKHKKPLTITPRVKRLFATSILVTILTSVLVPLLTCNTFPEMVLQSDQILVSFALGSFLLVMIANIILSPVEKVINRRYYKDAQRILASMPQLTIIGITGSYGKTSTKHFLHRILSEQYNVLMTPGSYNTTLGVIRTIREQLKPYHTIFIVEMGAKQIGDIREICDLVHPSIGIITAVGEQHLESFKSIQNVQRTKFELIDALPADGLAILNNDFEYIANRAVSNVKNVIRYATKSSPEVNYHIGKVKYNTDATLFEIISNVAEGNFTTKLVGSCNFSNLLAGYIVAKYLNTPANAISYGISKIEPVEHRLSLKRTATGITIIDDAFNSNPDGARMALEVIEQFAGTRFVITPGLIELGEKQAFHNKQFGIKMASSCDYSIVVGQYNQEAIVAGLKEGNMDDAHIITVPTLTDAVTFLNANIKAGDVVLYENDLPDTFK